MSTKMIRTTTLIALVSGKSLAPFNEIHEAAEWVMGHSVWTHEFADKELWQRMRGVVLAKYPQLSVSVEHINSENYRDEIPKIEAMFPPTFAIEQGVQGRTEDPIDSLERIVSKAKGTT